MERALIGIDLGGTNIKSVLLDPATGRVLHAARTDTQAGSGVKAVVSNIVSAIARQQAVAKNQRRHCLAIGVGSAGLVDRGTVRNSPNLPGWQGAVPLSRLLGKELAGSGIPIVVENDVNAMVLAEQRLGAARGCRQVVGLTLGTGVGGGIIIDGRLYRGCRGGAGELGHTVISEDGPPCLCGNRGCLEALVGAAAIVARYRGRDPGTRGKRPGTTVAMISAAARRGDRRAVAALRETGRLLGVGLANIVNTFDPEMIVIGGGVAGAGGLILEPAVREMERRAMPYNAAHVRVRRAGLGPQAGAIGAALAAADGIARGDGRGRAR
ncbi:MAG: ROK family protein [Candidatus Edwardsbacteria bacterium]|jgi:glucokinase|nr:ROK family protein [Candidatus Edwardsbacteria bacterium]